MSHAVYCLRKLTVSCDVPTIVVVDDQRRLGVYLKSRGIWILLCPGGFGENA